MMDDDVGDSGRPLHANGNGSSVVVPFHLLTEVERECLRLAEQGHTSKRIAADRGVRRDTIDKIFRAALAKLGNLPRHDAARMLVEDERYAAQ